MLELTLVLRRVHHATAIEQRQRIARAETAQIEPADVTARRVHATADVGDFVDEIAAVLRDEIEELLTRFDTEELDGLAADDGDRQGVGDHRAAYLRARDDDFFEGLGCRCGLLCRGRRGGHEHGHDRGDCGRYMVLRALHEYLPLYL
jgi:hypothetical protein